MSSEEASNAQAIAKDILNSRTFESLVKLLAFIYFVKDVFAKCLATNYPMLSLTWEICDNVLITVFAIETGLKMIAAKNRRAYFRNPWNYVDVGLVFYSLLTLALRGTPCSDRFYVTSIICRALKLASLFEEPRNVLTAVITSFGAFKHPFMSGLILTAVLSLSGSALFYQIENGEDDSSSFCSAEPSPSSSCGSTADFKAKQFADFAALSFTKSGWSYIMKEVMETSGSGQIVLVTLFTILLWMLTSTTSGWALAVFMSQFSWNRERIESKRQFQLLRNAQKDKIHQTSHEDTPSEEETDGEEDGCPPGTKIQTTFAKQILESKIWIFFVNLVLAINALLLSISSSEDPLWNFYCELMFSVIFSCEIALRMVRFRCKRFEDTGDLLNFILVVGSIIDLLLELFSGTIIGFRYLRLFRLIALLEFTRFWPHLRNMLISLMNSLRTLSITLIMTVMFLFASALIGSRLLKDFRFVNGDIFGSFSESLLSATQIVTEDSWITHFSFISSSEQDPPPWRVICYSFGLLFVKYFPFFCQALLFAMIFDVVVGSLQTSAELSAAEEAEEAERRAEESKADCATGAWKNSSPFTKMLKRMVLSFKALVAPFALFGVFFLVFTCFFARFFKDDILVLLDERVPTATRAMSCSFKYKFDSFKPAATSLLILASGENWAEILRYVVNNESATVFEKIVTVVWLVAFFASCLFFSLYIVVSYIYGYQGDDCYFKLNLDTNQKECLEFAIDAKPLWKNVHRRGSKLAPKIDRLVRSANFKVMSTCLIIFQALSVASQFWFPEWFERKTVEALNVGLTFLLAAEILAKLIAYGPKSFLRSGWNRFDLILFVGICLSFHRDLPINFEFLLVFRCLRLIRLISYTKWLEFKLLRFAKFLYILASVATLLLAFYATIGTLLFGGVSQPQHHCGYNFDTFFNSLVLLFRCAVAPNWHFIMQSYANALNSSCFVYIYFFVFIFLSRLLIWGLVVGAIADACDLFIRDPSIMGCHHLTQFLHIWSLHDPDASGYIHQTKLLSILRESDPPLGFGSKCPTVLTYQQLIEMNLPVSKDGKVSLNALLLGLVRVKLGLVRNNSIDTNFRHTLHLLRPDKVKLIDSILPGKGDQTLGMHFCCLMWLHNWRHWRNART